MEQKLMPKTSAALITVVVCLFVALLRMDYCTAVATSVIISVSVVIAYDIRALTLQRRLAAASEDEKRTRQETLAVHLPGVLEACQSAGRHIALGSADAAELHRLRRVLIDGMLLQLARCNPTPEELYRLLAGVDPIVLRDVVEHRLGTGACARNEHARNNGAIRLDAVDMELERLGEKAWSYQLLQFVRSPSTIVPADRLADWEKSSRSTA